MKCKTSNITARDEGENTVCLYKWLSIQVQMKRKRDASNQCILLIKLLFVLAPLDLGQLSQCAKVQHNSKHLLLQVF